MKESEVFPTRLWERIKAKRKEVNKMHYKLEGKEVVEVKDLIEWAKWFEEADRHVALTEIGIPVWKYWIGKLLHLKKWEPVRVSTVFLGIDHSFVPAGPPSLFETMVFGGKHDGETDRHSTWQKAEQGHKEMCETVFGKEVNRNAKRHKLRQAP